jgi:hypothetical protein
MKEREDNLQIEQICLKVKPENINKNIQEFATFLSLK